MNDRESKEVYSDSSKDSRIQIRQVPPERDTN